MLVGKFFRTVLTAVIATLLPAIASAASLSVTPSTGTATVGSQLTVNVALNTGTDSARALAFTLSYDRTKLD